MIHSKAVLHNEIQYSWNGFSSLLAQLLISVCLCCWPIFAQTLGVNGIRKVHFWATQLITQGWLMTLPCVTCVSNAEFGHIVAFQRLGSQQRAVNQGLVYTRTWQPITSSKLKAAKHCVCVYTVYTVQKYEQIPSRRLNWQKGSSGSCDYVIIDLFIIDKCEMIARRGVRKE